MAGFLIPVGPDVPASLQAILQSFHDAILDLQQPGSPSAIWAHPTAATLEATAPAADYPGGFCMVLDINSIAVSTKVAGSYAWRRADGGAM